MRSPLNVDQLGVDRAPAWLRSLGILALVGVAYYATAQLSLRFSIVEDNVTPLWPPTGVAVVGFLLVGRRTWPAVALAALLVNLPISASVPAAAATAAGNTLAPWLAALLLVRLDFHHELDRSRDALSIVAVALGCMVVSATVGAGTLRATGAITASEFPGAWAVWWAGDAMGVLVVAPFLLTARTSWKVFSAGWAPFGQALALFSVLVLVCVFAFTSDLPLLFLVLPVLGWAAWRFQQAGATPAALLVCGLAAFAATRPTGPFSEGPLLDRMLTLQAFDASVAFTSFFFAALVAERASQRHAVEDAAKELEERVHLRTAELSGTNQRLTREIAEREEAEGSLRRSERQLAEAQAVAQMGSWAWNLQTDEVTWSDELYRIYGHEPGAFDLTFDRAIDQVVEEDAAMIRRTVGASIAQGLERLADLEYRIVRGDGSERMLLGSARLQFEGGVPVRMLGAVLDLTDRREHEREHRVAETLQQALLPRELPSIEGITLSAHYVPADRHLSAGGDWYDALVLPDGRLGLVIGDVAGHGLDAASVMGQLRMALRAYVLDGYGPSEVAVALNMLLTRFVPMEMATMLYLVLDPSTGTLVAVNAGHPPVLVLANDSASYLEMPRNLPLGVDPGARYEVGDARVEPGGTIVLFTDGLIDRHDLNIVEGSERARLVAEQHANSVPSAIGAALLGELVPEEVSDDVAILLARVESVASATFRLEVPATPIELASIRARLRRWLVAAGVPIRDGEDLVLACNEACSNAIEHAYGGRDGVVQVEGELTDGTVHLVVRDFGSWHDRASGGGRGLRLIEACSDDVDVRGTPWGTELRIDRSVSRVHA